ncbi:hypothetical protein D9758_014674 [Tetrapyrgos nigripes]|uniref:Uncharacterized protein n=1 Tax=Tetrapyrgos nigripes TaxID=182062 RepID=A0A8H5FP89_9AGAR|nr:hypothetical protein D9758_014674 [Tetrapyrgos nigripes]
MAYLTSTVTGLRFCLRTLYLFTKSDIQTLLVPVAILGFAAAPLWSARHAAEQLMWIWIHLLQFTISNQSCSLNAVTEDSRNKAYRPIPSGRMTLKQAHILRWIFVCIGLAISYKLSFAVLGASCIIVLTTICYNELDGGGRHWVMRNWLNGVGFGAFQTGATLVAGRDRTQLDIVAAKAIGLSSFLFMTTAHTQDLLDVQGDMKIGRSTLALEHPRVARRSILLILSTWSLVLSREWNLHAVFRIFLCGIAVYVGLRFLFKVGQKEDRQSFYWYIVWLSTAYATPMWYRWMLPN